MNARIEDARPPGETWREDAKPPGAFRRRAGAIVRVLVQGLFLAAGVAVTVLGFARFVDAHDTVGAHRHAPLCGTAAATPGTDCLQRESARVTARRIAEGDESVTYWLTVAREAAGTRSYSVGESFYHDVEVGAEVELAVHRGRVAELSYHGHRAENLITPWWSMFVTALLAGSGAALTAQGAAWRRSGPQVGPFIVSVVVVGVTFFGGIILTGLQWPLTVSLVLAALAWLFLTAACTATAWDE